MSPLRQCITEDFERKGFFPKNDKYRESMLQRLCPDMEQISEQLKIRNGYNSNNDRISFSIEMHKCN